MSKFKTQDKYDIVRPQTDLKKTNTNSRNDQ